MKDLDSRIACNNGNHKHEAYKIQHAKCGGSAYLLFQNEVPSRMPKL